MYYIITELYRIPATPFLNQEHQISGLLLKPAIPRLKAPEAFLARLKSILIQPRCFRPKTARLSSGTIQLCRSPLVRTSNWRCLSHCRTKFESEKPASRMRLHSKNIAVAAIRYFARHASWRTFDASYPGIFDNCSKRQHSDGCFDASSQAINS